MVIGIFFGIVSASLWATTSLAVKVQSARVDTLSFNAFRMVVGALLFSLLLPLFGGWEALTSLSGKSLAALSVSIICGGVIGDTLYFWSMTQIGASRAMPLSGIYPLFTWALAVPLLGETMTVRAILGTIFVLVGLTLLAPSVEVEHVHTAHWNRLGVLAAIFAAAMWALSTTMMKIGLQDGVNIVAINSFRMSLGAIVLTFFVLRWRDKSIWKSYDRASLPTLIGISLLSTGIGSIFWILSVEYAGAARSALINAMAPLLGAPLAIIFLHERVNWKIGLGTCLAMLGVAMVI